MRVNKKHTILLARFSFFVVFFYFGILKVLGLSPASRLVSQLLDVTFLSHFFNHKTFSLLFGFFEMLIGIFALFKSFDKLTFYLISFHLLTTILPLFLLPQVTWAQIFVPTLVGQYIIKNIILYALALITFCNFLQD